MLKLSEILWVKLIVIEDMIAIRIEVTNTEIHYTTRIQHFVYLVNGTPGI